MKTTPRIRRSFDSDFDELIYLNELITHRLYVQKKRSAELPHYKHRPRWILNRIGFTMKALVLNEGMSLYRDLSGDAWSAMKYRARELQLIQELYADIEKEPYLKSLEKVLLKRYGSRDIRFKVFILQELTKRMNADAASIKRQISQRRIR